MITSLKYWFFAIALGYVIRLILWNIFHIPAYHPLINLPLSYVILRFSRCLIYRNCPESYRLADGATVLITGATAGIGVETAKELTRRGGKVVWAGRNIAKAEAAMKSMEPQPHDGPPGSVMRLDLASLEAINRFADEFNKKEENLNVLILNAAANIAEKKSKTADGFETNIGVNHLGHMYLTYLLLKKLETTSRAEEPARIVIVGSDIHAIVDRLHIDDLMSEDQTYTGWGWIPYAHSKLCTMLFARHLAKLVKDRNIIVHIAHPGTPIYTDLIRDSIFDQSVGRTILSTLSHLFLPWSSHAAQAITYVTTAPELATVTGKFYQNCGEGWLAHVAKDDEGAAELWDASCKLLNIPNQW